MSTKKIPVEKYLTDHNINYLENGEFLAVWCQFCKKTAIDIRQLTFHINPIDGYLQCQDCGERPSPEEFGKMWGLRDKIIAISDGQISIDDVKTDLYQTNNKSYKPNENKYQPKVWSLDELLAYKFPEQKWIIAGLIPVGTVNMMSAEPSTGKTWLTLEISRCVATGESFLGELQTIQGAVMIVNLEDAPMYIQERLKKLSVKPDNPISFIYDELNMENGSAVDTLLDLAQERNVKLIIFDSFRRLHTGDENESRTSNDVFKQLKKFSTIGIAVLVTHHHRKKQTLNSGDYAQKIRGSSDIFASLDSHIVIESEGNDINVYPTKMRVAQALAPFKIIKDDSWHFTYGGPVDSKVRQKDKAKDLILTILKDGPNNRKDIETKLLEVAQIGHNTTGIALKELEQEKEILVRIEGPKKKIYFLPQIDTDRVNDESIF